MTRRQRQRHWQCGSWGVVEPVDVEGGRAQCTLFCPVVLLWSGTNSRVGLLARSSDHLLARHRVVVVYQAREGGERGGDLSCGKGQLWSNEDVPSAAPMLHQRQRHSVNTRSEEEAMDLDKGDCLAILSRRPPRISDHCAMTLGAGVVLPLLPLEAGMRWNPTHPGRWGRPRPSPCARGHAGGK